MHCVYLVIMSALWLYIVRSRKPITKLSVNTCRIERIECGEVGGGEGGWGSSNMLVSARIFISALYVCFHHLGIFVFVIDMYDARLICTNNFHGRVRHNL